MPEHQHATHSIETTPGRLSREEEQKRKQSVLTQGKASITRSIADAVVVKDDNLFFLTPPDGSVPLADGHGYGLYYHDCRYLKGYELKLAGGTPDDLVSTAVAGFRAVFELTNPEIKMANGEHIAKNDVGVTWERTIDGQTLVLHDLLTFQNFGLQEVEFPVSLAFQAEFKDVFAIRGLLQRTRGTLEPPSWKDDVLHFVYTGADGLYRSLSIHFSPRPDSVDATTAEFNVTLQPRERKQIRVSLFLAEAPDRSTVQPATHTRPDLERIEMNGRRRVEEWVGGHTEVHSDGLLLDRVITRSIQDLRLLQSHIGGDEFIAAGLPWFGTLFGRDSIITALQMLAYNPAIAEQTLRLLAKYQGREVDEWKDEQPGKILHELRVGELARLGEIPHTPYYGTVDATPLFLILVGRHAAWTGSLALFDELRGNVELALEWMSKYGDSNGDGYIEYQSSSEEGLINQGWKDSGDAIVNDDGSLARPPIALVEVQGYAYLARTLIADLYERAGEPERAERLRREAEALRSRFNRDFWLEDKGIYALALQADHRPCAVVSSNPGQALWTGIADPDKARRTVERLMAADMYSGWGVRTFSTQEVRYNPVGYHLGSVWPHDNSMIAAGFRRYGFDEAAKRVAVDTIQAATFFNLYRLPELFSGFEREAYGVPVRYPVACHPQAWAAGSVPYLIEALLGLVPEAFEKRLRIVRPLLPDFVDFIEVRRLKVGDASVDVRFARTSQGVVTANVISVDGELDVVIEAEESDAASVLP